MTEEQWFGRDFTIREVMRSIPMDWSSGGLETFRVPADAPLSCVLRSMIERHVDSAVVLGRQGNPIGVFSARDALVLLHELILTSDCEIDVIGDEATTLKSTAPEGAVVVPFERRDRQPKVDPLDRVDQASIESFPASDAPGWRI